MSKTKGKAPAKKTKTPAKTTKASDKPGGRGVASKLSKSRKPSDADSKGINAKNTKKGVISGRTRIGEVPDALMIYKGE